MEGVSLQAVTLSDGSTAYIQHNSKGISRSVIANYLIKIISEIYSFKLWSVYKVKLYLL